MQAQCSPASLVQGIEDVHKRKLVPYESGIAAGIVQQIDTLFA